MSNKRWLIFTTAFLSGFAFLFSMQAAPPLIPTITDEFQLSHTQAAGIMLFAALPAMLLSIPGGFLADRYGRKKLSIIGIAFVCLGTSLTALSPSFGLLQGSRVLVGIGGALLLSCAPSLISQWFSGKELNFAMGIWSINMPLATVTSFNLLNRVELTYGWRYSFGIAAVLAAIILIVCAIFMEEKRTLRPSYSLAPLRTVPMWILAFIWSVFVMANLSLTTWGKTLFTDLNISPVRADFLASLVMLLSFATPLTGYLAGRIGMCRPLILISLAGMIVCFALLPATSGLLLTLLVVLGLFGALAPPCIFALPPGLVGLDNTAQGFGMLNTAMNFGVVVGPLIVGRVMDVTQGIAAAFYTMASFTALGLLFTFLLRTK